MPILSKDFSNALKGLCSLVVVMVHVPMLHQNPLQDAIGSFAFVCVTIFFMISSYGMLCASRRKGKAYLEYFWRNRLSSLLVPCLFVNILFYVISLLTHSSNGIISILDINPYVVALLQWCMLFYAVEWLRIKTGLSDDYADAVLAIGIVAMSLISYFFCKEGEISPLSWSHERMGLLWGLIVFRYEDFLCCLGRKRVNVKFIVMLVLSFALGLLYIKFKTAFFWGEYLLKITLGLSLIVTTLLCNQVFTLRWHLPILKWLGAISYIIYLCHFYVMCNIDLLIPGLSSWSFIAMTYLITLVIAGLLTPISTAIVRKIRHN